MDKFEPQSKNPEILKKTNGIAVTYNLPEKVENGVKEDHAAVGEIECEFIIDGQKISIGFAIGVAIDTVSIANNNIPAGSNVLGDNFIKNLENYLEHASKQNRSYGDINSFMTDIAKDFANAINVMSVNALRYKSAVGVFAILINLPNENCNYVMITHAGDSRAYCLGNNRLELMTVDQNTYFNSLRNLGVNISTEDALLIDRFRHESPNGIAFSEAVSSYLKSKEVNINQEVEFYSQYYFYGTNGSQSVSTILSDHKSMKLDYHIIPKAGRILLCTDGISDNLTQEQLSLGLSKSTLLECSGLILEMATKGYKKDDMSFVILN